MKAETERWAELAEEDRSIATAALEASFFRPCIFHCQQALEKLLKAIWIERATEGLPRRTHDLVSLCKELDLGLSEEWLEFLRRLSEQYIPTRYGDAPVEYSRESAENYHERTREIFSWLRQQLS